MSIRPPDIIPVSEVQIPFNKSVALNLCFLCNLGSPSQNSSIRRKTCHAPYAATLQHDSSIRTNRADIVAVFEGCPIQYNKHSLSFKSLHLLGTFSYPREAGRKSKKCFSFHTGEKHGCVSACIK